jgi:uncharacterized protein YprB with RNaseH-like and TPR domain
MTDEISTVFFDIETTGLIAKAGDIILTCAFIDLKAPESDYYVIGNLSTPQDYDIAVEIKDYLKRYDRIVSWNGHGFDLRFINERLKTWYEPSLLHRGSFDLKEYCKATYPYIGGSQEEWLVAIDAVHQKTPLDIEQNRKIGRNEGSPEDWQELVHHNVEDILGLREIYNYVFHREDV